MIRIINEEHLLEMALSHKDALNRACSLGYEFVIHFDKVYKNPNDTAVHHWKSEMQTWYNQVNSIVLKGSKRKLSNTELEDWFFTAGSSYDVLFKSNQAEIRAYKKFIKTLSETNDVSASLKGE